MVPGVKEALRPGGFILQEQHYVADYNVSGPADPRFRMRPNELLHLFMDFRVRHFSESLEWEPERDGGRFIALGRLAAQKPPASREPAAPVRDG